MKEKVEKIDRKADIKAAAKRLFKEKGYAGTSMRDLAKEVGIEAASLYNHLGSKGELLHEICFDIADQFFNSYTIATEAEKSPIKKLKAAIKSHVCVIANNLDASAVFFHEWIFLTEPDLTNFKKLRYTYEQGFRELIQSGVAEKDFKEVNVKLVVFTIFSALNATYDLLKGKDQLSPDEIAENIGNLLLKGLKK
jgi:hypothetical protein